MLYLRRSGIYPAAACTTGQQTRRNQGVLTRCGFHIEQSRISRLGIRRLIGSDSTGEVGKFSLVTGYRIEPMLGNKFNDMAYRHNEGALPA